MEHLDGGASQWRARIVNESCGANAPALHRSCNSITPPRKRRMHYEKVSKTRKFFLQVFPKLEILSPCLRQKATRPEGCQ